MISRIQSNSLAFKGKFELVIPENQKRMVNQVLNGSCSPGLPKDFVQKKLSELEQDTKQLPDDDIVRVTLSSQKRTEEHLKLRYDNTPIIGAIKEMLSPLVNKTCTEDNLLIKLDYLPGEQSQSLGLKKQTDNGYFSSEKLRSLAIYNKCKYDKTGLNGLDVFSFKENTEIYRKLTERINTLFGIAKSAYADLMAQTPAKEAQVRWPDDELIQQYKSIGNSKDDTRCVIRTFGQTLVDLLEALGSDPKITALKDKINEQIALSTKSFSTNTDLFKRIITSTLQPEEINLLKEIILESDYSGKLQIFDRPQTQPIEDVLNIFVDAQGPFTEKGPVNKLLFNLLNVGHRNQLGNEKLKEIQQLADRNNVNIDPCIQTKGNPYYDINCALEFCEIDEDQHTRLAKLIDSRQGKKISDEEYRKLVLEICPNAEDLELL